MEEQEAKMQQAEKEREEMEDKLKNTEADKMEQVKQMFEVNIYL